MTCLGHTEYSCIIHHPATIRTTNLLLMTISVEILVPTCVSELDVEESAYLLDADFDELLVPLLGSAESILNNALIFDKRDTLRLIGDSSGKIDSVLLLLYNAKTAYNRNWLIKFASALARTMNVQPGPRTITPEWMSSVKGIPQPRDFRSVKTHGDIPYYDINLKDFIGSKISDKFITMLADTAEHVEERIQPSSSSYPSSSSLSSPKGTSLSDLKYDDESIAITRTLFGFHAGMPASSSASIKTSRRCMNPEHADTNPSMEIFFRPLYWRNSSVVMEGITKEQDEYLEKKYMEGRHQHCVVGSRDIILFCVGAKCYSTRCSLKFKNLSNEEIKRLNLYCTVFIVPTSACTYTQRRSYECFDS